VCKYSKLLKNSETLFLEIPPRGLQIILEANTIKELKDEILRFKNEILKELKCQTQSH
jgi:hypothetical protein